MHPRLQTSSQVASEQELREGLRRGVQGVNRFHAWAPFGDGRSRKTDALAVPGKLKGCSADTTADLKGLEVVTIVRRLAKKEHAADRFHGWAEGPEQKLKKKCIREKMNEKTTRH